MKNTGQGVVSLMEGGWRWESLRERLPVLLAWSCLLLLPFGRLVELPVLVMAVWAVVLIVREGRSMVWRGGAKLFTLVFLAFWIPAVLSAFDAVNVGKTLRTVLTLPRLYLAGIFIIHFLATPEAWRRFLKWSAWVLVFWLGDAILQALVGVDLFGFERIPQRLNGLFGDKLKLGIVLAVFSPLLFEYARHTWSRKVCWLLSLTTLVVLLLAGSRAGWVMFAVLLGAYGLIMVSRRGRLPYREVGAVLVLAVTAAVSLYQFSDDFKRRADQTLLFFQGDERAMDAALSGRLPIWRTAVDMIARHPVNGVGARGFRYDYPAHARPGDPFLGAGGTGATHAHQLLLDVLSETGLIGGLGLGFAFWVLARAWARAAPAQRRWMLPGALGVLAALFPVNTHLALYSSFWSQILLWLIALYFAGMAAGQATGAGGASHAGGGGEA